MADVPEEFVTVNHRLRQGERQLLQRLWQESGQTQLGAMRDLTSIIEQIPPEVLKRRTMTLRLPPQTQEAIGRKIEQVRQAGGGNCPVIAILLEAARIWQEHQDGEDSDTSTLHQTSKEGDTRIPAEPGTTSSQPDRSPEPADDSGGTPQPDASPREILEQEGIGFFSRLTGSDGPDGSQ